MNPLLACREASRLASEALDRPLSLSQRLELRLHLAMCSACRRYQRQIVGLDRIIRNQAGRAMDADLTLSPAARARIRQALAGKP